MIFKNLFITIIIFILSFIGNLFLLFKLTSIKPKIVSDAYFFTNGLGLTRVIIFSSFFLVVLSTILGFLMFKKLKITISFQVLVLFFFSIELLVIPLGLYTLDLIIYFLSLLFIAILISIISIFPLNEFLNKLTDRQIGYLVIFISCWQIFYLKESFGPGVLLLLVFVFLLEYSNRNKRLNSK